MEFPWEFDTTFIPVDLEEFSLPDFISLESSDKNLQKTKKKRKKRKKRKTNPPTEKQVQRLRHTQRCKFTFNRMVKDDLRRQFPLMFCNVTNIANTELTKSFLSRYLLPDCDVLADPLPQFGFPSLHLKGPSQFAEYMALANAPLPDFTVILLGGRVIRQFYEEIAIVEVYTSFKATRPAYPKAILEGDQITDCDDKDVADSVTMEEFEFKIMASFFMNNEGFITKVDHCIPTSIPAFLSSPSTSGINAVKLIH
eukprot:scaffold428_cov168-Ochromonas_danica.AAC.31